MQFILDRNAIRDLEYHTIKRKGITPTTLMKTASDIFTREFVKEVETETPILIIVGKGNNGGDGLMIGKNLLDLGYNINILMPSLNKGSSKDKIKKLINEIVQSSEANIFINGMRDFVTKIESEKLVIIDALYGIGLNREVAGIPKKIIGIINKSVHPVYSVDVPSGIDINRLDPYGCIVRSTKTFTFHSPKVNFLLEAFGDYVPEFKILRIGLETDGWQHKKDITKFFITQESVKDLIKRKSKFIYKYKNGHMLLVAGSYGKIGAAILAGLGAVRTGVGLLTCHVPKMGYNAVQSVLIGSLFDISKNQNFVMFSSNKKKYNSLVFGCGVGINEHARNSLYYILKKIKVPLVIDADGLNLIAENKKLLTFIHPNWILTPHNKEFERIVGKWNSEEEKFQKLKLLSSYTKSIVILKGAYTCIAEPEGKLFFNSSGNNGMAIAGMGDVLAGVIGSFLAQGYCPLDASIIGVYLHGLSGDICAKEIGQEGFTADDVANYLPKAITTLNSKTAKAQDKEEVCSFDTFLKKEEDVTKKINFYPESKNAKDKKIKRIRQVFNFYD